MANPWLSILIPVYGVEPYLQACVGSVLEQWVDGVEVLLLDDVSPDRSGEIARDLQRRHPEAVQVYAHTRNRGLSAARNTLLGHASGDYAWFLDSDDLLLPGAIDGLRRVVEADAPDLVLCDFRVVRERLTVKHRLRGEMHRRTFRGRPGLSHDRAALVAGLLSRRQLHSWSKIARRGIWQQAPFPEGRAFEDMAVIPALVGAVGSYRHVPAPWVGYRQRAGSILASWSDDRLADLLQSLRDLYHGLSALPALEDPEARFALDYFCLRTFAMVARRVGRGGQSEAAADACPGAALRELFPQGPGPVLQQCGHHGWWLRKWRLQRSLALLEQAA